MEQANQKIKILKYKSDQTAQSDVIAVSYSRYSTDNQLSTSTEDQQRRIRRSHQNNEIKSILFPNSKMNLAYECNDDAISGFGTIGRNGLDKVISLIRSGNAQIIIVDDFKRFLRSMGSALDLYDLLQEFSAELISISDGFSSAEPSARLKFMNKAYASEEFLDGVSRDTRRGLNERRYEGFSDGHLWFGIGSKPTRQIQVKGKLKDSYFEYYIIEQLAAVVIRIFNLYRDGYSTKNIAKTMNLENVPAPACYDKNGEIKETDRKHQWRDKTIWHILNNKAYIGILERGKTKIIKRNDGTKQVIQIPRDQWLVTEMEEIRIVPQDLWNAIRERTGEYHKKKAMDTVKGRPFKFNGTTQHVLTGVCKCAECGGNMTIVSGRHGGRYGCINGHKYRTCQNKKTIIATKLEEPILKWLISQITSDEIATILAKKYNEFRSLHVNGDTQELVQKEDKILQLQHSVDNLVAAIENGSPPQSLIDRLGKLEREKLTLEERVKYLKGLDKSKVYVTPAAIKGRLEQVPELLIQSEPFEINRALKPILKRSKGIVLEKRTDDHGKEVYWASGTANIGRFVSLSNDSEHSSSKDINLEVPFCIKLD